MLNITDNAEEQKKIPAFFRLGFRPMFLSAAFFATLAIAIWIGALAGFIQLQPVHSSLWWHGHEMVFGFACAVIVGFLLTAVQNWTGQMGLRGWPLFGLWSVWLLARLLLLLNFKFIPLWLTTAIDLAFLPLAAFFLARPIVRIKQYRNLFFVPVLLLLTVCNLFTHLEPLSQGLQHGAYGAILFVTLVMAVMGGRVIPFFTANACKFPKPTPIYWIEIASLVSVWLIAFGFLFKLHLQQEFSLAFAGMFAVAGVSNLVRVARWGFAKTLSVPLLWSLHLAYLFIPLTFLLLAWHFATGDYLLGSLLHGLTAGAMGNMILAMMARVSLGHSGRTLKVAAIIPSAFGALVFAGVIRMLGVLFQNDLYLASVYSSAILWCYGFAVFTIVYWPILTKPRVDGRPG